MFLSCTYHSDEVYSMSLKGLTQTESKLAESETLKSV